MQKFGLLEYLAERTDQQDQIEEYVASVYFERRDDALGITVRSCEAASVEEAIAKFRSIENTIWTKAKVRLLWKLNARKIDLSLYPKESLSEGETKDWSGGIPTEQIDFGRNPGIWRNANDEFWVEAYAHDGEKKGPIGKIYLCADGLWTFDLKGAQVESKQRAEAMLERWKLTKPVKNTS